jgi:hypothetical protein
MDPSPDSVTERAMLGPEAFYDDLADEYHLVYADWRRSVLEINTVLDRIQWEGPERADPDFAPLVTART